MIAHSDQILGHVNGQVQRLTGTCIDFKTLMWKEDVGTGSNCQLPIANDVQRGWTGFGEWESEFLDLGFHGGS